jgi:hypothetical protein
MYRTLLTGKAGSGGGYIFFRMQKTYLASNMHPPTMTHPGPPYIPIGERRGLTDAPCVPDIVIVMVPY